MQRITMIAGIVLASLVTCQSLIGQSTHGKKGQPRTGIEDIKKRPDLGVDYARVANFKLASRKTTYRVGEMISIDLAIMNTSDSPVFFHELNRPSVALEARDQGGTVVLINDYTTALEATSLESYRETKPSHLVLASFQLLAGCTSDVDAFLEHKYKLSLEDFQSGEAGYFRRLFEDALFVNWGQACFASKKPGKYAITAEQSNDAVLVSPQKPKMKTAVGTIRSTPLTITITD